ncbi:B-cadherin-like [Cyprinodon tularosa]|uniref:B-cadherin-like n=1 Tax=Cyprinodon tularosa TaxID=77115 RepID=UPI0018E22155|nr:B-cadherin-like [Cyprinodon tularosa]
MGTNRFTLCSVIIIILQVSAAWAAEESPCVPGKQSDQLVVTVTKKHLRHGTVLGKVAYTDSKNSTRSPFWSDDKHFVVRSDGTLTGIADEEVPILHFPKAPKGMKRRKRAWILPPISVTENQRGPFPLKISQVKSDDHVNKRIRYKITGPGADQDPVKLFTMDEETGHLYVTQPLDREKQSSYTLKALAELDGSAKAEDPIDVTIVVIDQNDNNPVFKKTVYNAEVPESSTRGFEFIQVEATDADEQNTDNSDIRYRIMEQIPETPDPEMFTINAVTGTMRVNMAKLDREEIDSYTLKVQVADQKGEGLTGETTVIIKVTDSNDHAPIFTNPSYKATAGENEVDAELVRMSVTDKDEEHSPNSNAKFTIVGGDPGNLFSVKTGSNKLEGIITTAKGLDFEKTSKHTLLVAVQNEVPFATALTTSTATVEVTVRDVNEPPIFETKETPVSKREDLPVESTVVQLTATDPDVARKQKVKYKIFTDPANWLRIDENTGKITVKDEMDRESVWVKDNRYTAIITAYDDDQIPATGTGTLIIELEDVNDNPPVIEEREFKMCNEEPVPQILTVKDKDGPDFTSPYSVSLQGPSNANWTARMNDTKMGIILTLKTKIPRGDYKVVLSVEDNQGLSQVSTVAVKVCDCTGEEPCMQNRTGSSSLPVTLGILGAVLLLFIVLAVVLISRWNKKTEKVLLLPPEDDLRDEIVCYDEEGGGEDDQDYDLSVIHHGLDNRPDKVRSDVAPMERSQPHYRHLPNNQEDMASFIDHNRKLADNDLAAPPFDSLLVFDSEGGESKAGSLSSLYSSNDGDQDYEPLKEWGPRFKKLADMYGGGENDDML